MLAVAVTVTSTIPIFGGNLFIGMIIRSCSESGQNTLVALSDYAPIRLGAIVITTAPVAAIILVFVGYSIYGMIYSVVLIARWISPAVHRAEMASGTVPLDRRPAAKTTLV